MARNRSKQRSTRRQFLGAAATAATSLTIVPRHVLGGPGQTPPSERLHLAGIGAGGNMCRHDLKRFVDRKQNVVALADPWDVAGWQGPAKDYFQKHYPRANVYRDYRKLLEAEKGIDGLVVATPDHWHAKITLDAMRLGKAVYTEKPLTRTISESRILAKVARQTGVATQMGNNGHAGEWIRLVCEYVWDGVMGPVHEVHAWSDRAGNFWPQGIARPPETPPVPANLDWDLWLGPAPSRPYHPAYLPIAWRGWCDFGAGALGDMGCHIMDAIFWSLKLGHPQSVEAASTLDKENTKGETFPRASIITYRFPAREEMPPVTITWYDGGLKPPVPAEFAPGRKLADNGALFVGTKGKLYNETFQPPELLPASLAAACPAPKKHFEPRGADHYVEWIDAAKGRDVQCGSSFDYAAALTEFVLLGVVASRIGEKLYWDGPQMRITNLAEANELVHHHYRDGWSL